MITREEILENADIAKLIGSYFPLIPVDEDAFSALCPFHHEKSASFIVTPKRRSYRCSDCGAEGNVVDFVIRYEHVDEKRALQMLAQWLGEKRV